MIAFTDKYKTKNISPHARQAARFAQENEDNENVMLIAISNHDDSDKLVTKNLH